MPKATFPKRLIKPIFLPTDQEYLRISIYSLIRESWCYVLLIDSQQVVLFLRLWEFIEIPYFLLAFPRHLKKSMRILEHVDDHVKFPIAFRIHFAQ